MASLSHLAVGLVAARHCSPEAQDAPAHRGRCIFWMCVLSMLPDIDVLTFSLGIAYEAPLGHRGAAHSLVAAAVFAVLLVPLLRTSLKLSVARGFVLGTLVIASHGLLDTLTDGGYGIALFWPMSDQRFFAPWQPIPVSPIGMAYLSKRGLMVFMTEFIYCLPLLAYGFWPQLRRGTSD